MPSPLSVDLRERVVAIAAEGAFCHRAAARFGSACRAPAAGQSAFGKRGRSAPKPSGGDHASQRIEAHADLILATYEQEPRWWVSCRQTAWRSGPRRCGSRRSDPSRRARWRPRVFMSIGVRSIEDYSMNVDEDE